MNTETADLNAVRTGDGLDGGSFANNLDKGLAGIAILVDGADITGGEGVS